MSSGWARAISIVNKGHEKERAVKVEKLAWRLRGEIEYRTAATYLVMLKRIGYAERIGRGLYHIFRRVPASLTSYRCLCEGYGYHIYDYKYKNGRNGRSGKGGKRGCRRGK